MYIMYNFFLKKLRTLNFKTWATNQVKVHNKTTNYIHNLQFVVNARNILSRHANECNDDNDYCK